MLRLLSLVALSLSSTAMAQNVDFAFENFITPGVNVTRAPYHSTLTRTGSLSVVNVSGGRVQTETNSLPGGYGATLLVQHDARGSELWARPIRLHGEDLRTRVTPLPDGGFILLGAVSELRRIQLDAQGVIARYDPNGREVWRHEVEQRAPRNCDPGRICGFLDLQKAVFDSTHAYVTGVFQRGRFDIAGSTLRGRRSLNGFTIKLNLADGEPSWTRRSGGGDENLSMANGDLVRQNGNRTRFWAEHVSTETGRVTRRVNLEGYPQFLESFIAHDDGYAAVMSFEGRRGWHLVGWDAAGRKRFDAPVHQHTWIEAHGATLLVADSIREERRHPHRTLVAEGVRVSEIDSQGTAVRTAVFDGHWFAASLRPALRHGQLALTGSIADASRYAIAARVEGLRSTFDHGQPPGDIAPLQTAARTNPFAGF